ncbi:hypothetical protein K0C01_03620 [Salinarchaeum sp. IM2453]|uniref:DICT sensory domain-containing protein n=1 Tax=Salinarchaeum sp. IM2453 TaxID=2862870 RepID=UPI001C83EAD6|nr:DICT sensory domain-containing protein [Salinarchaeum sp. IM2453]QZA89247.1 hypothetical protein K0C01_03620 [Salinarchaeum sp. IM2453]
MGLADIVDTVRERSATLRVYNTEEQSMIEELRGHLADRNIEIITERTTTGRPNNTAVLEHPDRSPSAYPVPELLEMLQAEREMASRLSRHIDERSFPARDTQEMVHMSREIEDRAMRIGEGTLHAGFQYVSSFKDQQETYESLANQSMDVNIYAVPDEDPPESEQITLHLETTDEIEQTWFVVYDGGGDPLQQCALIAIAEDNDTYKGVLTYEPSIIEQSINHLNDKYLK